MTPTLRPETTSSGKRPQNFEMVSLRQGPPDAVRWIAASSWASDDLKYLEIEQEILEEELCLDLEVRRRFTSPFQNQEF